jgi:hypothetical protein
LLLLVAVEVGLRAARAWGSLRRQRDERLAAE